jgi:NADH:ubiquinone oxidoreductase subunit F (NADH-binding)
LTNPIEELLALQEARGHLTDEDLRGLGERLGIPLYELQGLASFYPHFRRTPPPALRVSACRDLSCHLRDGGDALQRLELLCAGRDDVEFQAISCPGQCDRAPACLINEVPAAPDAIEACLAGRSGVPDSAPCDDRSASARRRWRTDPYACPEEHYGELGKWAESRDFEGVIARIAESGLRGMGGAGFPTGRKWQLVREQAASPKVVVGNADESEPGAFKDRVILEELPHLVVEGMALAGLAVGAEQGWVYIRHEYVRPLRALRRAIEDARRRGVVGDDVCGSGLRFDLRIFVSPGGYILGEETALLEALEGRRGEPRNKPPFPGTVGLHGRPTLINNVETLAQVPRILRTGSAELKFFSISGDVAEPGVVEAPLGVEFRELVEQVGGMREGRELLAFQPGGASTAFLPAAHAEVRMDWESLRAAGSALGAGAVIVVGSGSDLVDLGRSLTAFFRNESCGKCVPCRLGTEKAVVLIDRRDDASLALLPELDEALRETSLCGLGQVALTPILSILKQLPPHTEEQGS